MSLEDYVDWVKMWKLEVVKKDQSHLKDTNKILFANLKRDINVMIIKDECLISSEKYEFVFCYQWGETRADPEGSYMSYYVECDLDFNVVNVIYNQG